jgi:hypothetical protein
MFTFTIVNVTDEELPFTATTETFENRGQADIMLTDELDFETQTTYRFVVSTS